MKDGYHQVPLKKEHRNLTCMSTPVGTMRWKVLVMGLKNGNAIFQRVMEEVLKEEECADPYVDDVIIGSTGNTEEELMENHEKDLRRVLDTLEQNKFVVDPRKAHLFMREVEFCGHVLREGKRAPSPGKLACLQKWELPNTITQLRGFLGLANYYSQYVKNYATLAGPLMDMLRVDKLVGKKGSRVPLKWTARLSQCFVDLKQALAQELELFQLEPDQPVRLRTDASDAAIGAVLEQKRLDTWGTCLFLQQEVEQESAELVSKRKINIRHCGRPVEMGRMDKENISGSGHRPQEP